MAVLYILQLRGDADDIAARVAAVDDDAWRILHEHGFVGETLGRTDDGIIIAEVWESPEGHDDGLAHPVVAAEFEEVARRQTGVVGLPDRRLLRIRQTQAGPVAPPETL